MSKKEEVITQRNCVASLVPAEMEILISKGVMVKITQALGGSFTVLIKGNLARIDEQDTDALGKQINSSQQTISSSTISQDDLFTIMRAVYDPEIPINIVDLGLIYQVDLQQVGDKFQVDIVMTLTAAGCGMGQVITDEVKYKIIRLEQVDDVNVELVFDPPWSDFMLSDEAKLELSLI